MGEPLFNAPSILSTVSDGSTTSESRDLDLCRRDDREATALGIRPPETGQNYYGLIHWTREGVANAFLIMWRDFCTRPLRALGTVHVWLKTRTEGHIAESTSGIEY